MVSIKMPQSKPLVTYTLLGITVAVYLLQLASQYFLKGVDIPAELGMKVNDLISRGQVWRLITPMFLHASIMHIGFNMYALLAFGPGLERHYGHYRYLLLYIVSGFAGNVMSFLFSSSPSLGSSTAIFGLLGAEGMFLYQNRQIFGRNAQRALVNILVIAGINLAIGLSVPGIDNWGHIGGALGGVLFAWTAGPVLRVEGVYPELRLVDGRGSREVLVTTLGVGIFFVLLLAVTIFLRK